MVGDSGMIRSAPDAIAVLLWRAPILRQIEAKENARSDLTIKVCLNLKFDEPKARSGARMSAYRPMAVIVLVRILSRALAKARLVTIRLAAPWLVLDPEYRSVW